MIWDGIERRLQDHRDPIIICKQEEKIDEMSDGIIRIEEGAKLLNSRINGSLEKMTEHVVNSDYWNRFIIGTAIALVISIVGGIFTAGTIAYNLGQYARQISVNTERLSNIEDILK